MLHTPLFELYRRLPYLGDTMKKETKAMLEMLAAAALWSIAGIIMKFIPWNGFAVAGMRSLIAGLTFVVYMLIKRMKFIFTKQTFIAGIFAACVYTCFTCANKLTTAANAIVLQFTSPVFIVIFTALIYKTKVRKADLLVVIFTLFGIALFFFDQLQPGYILGNFVAIAAGMFMAGMFMAVGDLEGETRLNAVVVADVDPATRRPIEGTEERIPCDTLVLSCGLIPENEVAKTAGVALSPITGGAIVDERLATSTPGIFACGNALHVHDLADFASEEGERAGASAAAFARGEMQGGSASADEAPIEVAAGEGVHYVVPQTISCDAEGAVMLSFRVSDVIEGVRFEVRESEDAGAGEVLARARDVVAVPAEMRRMKVDAESLVGCSRIVVSAVSGLSARRAPAVEGGAR